MTAFGWFGEEQTTATTKAKAKATAKKIRGFFAALRMTKFGGEQTTAKTTHHGVQENRQRQRQPAMVWR
jgi:hypothetical protein